MEIILSTRNPSKIAQIKPIFNGLNVEVISLNEAKILGEVMEDGATLEENATKKAMFAWEWTKKWSIADDTGIFIDFLNGEPGVRSARWAGENTTTEDIMNFTLQKLESVPEKNRTATFKTVAVAISPEGNKYAFTGEVAGRILTKPRAECQPNMPYSAIFEPDGQNKVWAEMTVEEENAVSHRGKAFAQMRDFFSKVLIHLSYGI